MPLSIRQKTGLAGATVALLIGTAGAAGFGAAASADTSENGDFGGFALGDPMAQFGWTANDIPVYNASHFDPEIADPTSVWIGGELGTRAHQSRPTQSPLGPSGAAPP